MQTGQVRQSMGSVRIYAVKDAVKKVAKLKGVPRWLKGGKQHRWGEVGELEGGKHVMVRLKTVLGDGGPACMYGCRCEQHEGGRGGVPSLPDHPHDAPTGDPRPESPRWVDQWVPHHTDALPLLWILCLRHHHMSFRY